MSNIASPKSESKAMKMEISAGALRGALRAFRGVIDRVNTIPVLGAVKILDNRIAGTNLDMEVSLPVLAFGKAEGGAAIDFFALNALVSQLDPDSPLVVAEEEGLATVQCGENRYRMQSMSVGDFPDFAGVDGPVSRVGNLGLVAAMSRVKFAIYRDPIRYYLNGVAFLTDASGQSYVVATDGHRLAMAPIDAMPEGAAGRILPRPLVAYLCRSRVEPDTLSFDVGKPLCRFELPGGTIVLAKLIDGTFPDIFRVCPQEAPVVLEIDRLELLRTLRRLQTFVGCQSVELVVEKDTLTVQGVELVSARSGREHLPLAATAPASWKAKVNCNYLIDHLVALRGDVVKFLSRESPAAGPFITTCDGDPLRLILMPRRWDHG